MKMYRLVCKGCKKSMDIDKEVGDFIDKHDEDIELHEYSEPSKVKKFTNARNTED